MVAGAAALVRARFPELSADEVSHRLVATAADAGPAGPDRTYGAGVVDLVAALTAEVPPPSPPATPSPDRDAAPAGEGELGWAAATVIAGGLLLAAVGTALLVAHRGRRD